MTKDECYNAAGVMTVDQVHENGVEDFGLAWVLASGSAIRVFTANGIDISGMQGVIALALHTGMKSVATGTARAARVVEDSPTGKRMVSRALAATSAHALGTRDTDPKASSTDDDGRSQKESDGIGDVDGGGTGK